MLLLMMVMMVKQGIHKHPSTSIRFYNLLNLVCQWHWRLPLPSFCFSFLFFRQEKRKWKETDSVPQKNELMENVKKRKVKKHSASIPRKNELNKFRDRHDRVKRASSDRRFSSKKLVKGQSADSILANKKNSKRPFTNNQNKRTKQPRKM